MSWQPSDIRGVFYVNDTLSPLLLERDVAADDVAQPVALQRTRRLADQTKLLPPSARGEAWRRLSAAGRADLARRLRETSLVHAAAALANARQAKALVEKELGGGVDLPVLQYTLSPECFDTAAVRARAAQRDGLPNQLDVKSL